MRRSSKSSPGSRPARVPSPTRFPTPPDDTKPASWDEEKLQKLFSQASKSEILQGWNHGILLASLQAAAQAGLVPLPEPASQPPAKAEEPKG